MEQHPLPPDLACSPFQHTLATNLDKTHACEAAIGYKFQDPWLLWEALQADGSPVAHLGIPRYEAGNMRLAIVGDRILDLLLALHWYPTGQKRGMLSSSSSSSLPFPGAVSKPEIYVYIYGGRSRNTDLLRTKSRL